uniref:Chemokine interleukin-8-like domain-containing protein n=1 Tax=Scophthalmus maximus TaxID=52904 RepID=A0A8D3AJT4_SCOMX
MVSGGVLMKCALVAVVLVAVVESGPTAQKLASCCTEVNKLEITEPILDYMIQKSNPPCVKAVIFQTESGLYCSYHRALWVGRKIKELSSLVSVQPSSPLVFYLISHRKAQSTFWPKVSLLSIITSTTSPPPPSTTSPPPPSTSSPPPPPPPPLLLLHLLLLPPSLHLPSSSLHLLPSSSLHPLPSSVLCSSLRQRVEPIEGEGSRLCVEVKERY